MNTQLTPLKRRQRKQELFKDIFRIKTGHRSLIFTYKMQARFDLLFATLNCFREYNFRMREVIDFEYYSRCRFRQANYMPLKTMFSEYSHINDLDDIQLFPHPFIQSFENEKQWDESNCYPIKDRPELYIMIKDFLKLCDFFKEDNRYVDKISFCKKSKSIFEGYNNLLSILFDKWGGCGHLRNIEDQFEKYSTFTQEVCDELIEHNEWQTVMFRDGEHGYVYDRFQCTAYHYDRRSPCSSDCDCDRCDPDFYSDEDEDDPNYRCTKWTISYDCE